MSTPSSISGSNSLQSCSSDATPTSNSNSSSSESVNILDSAQPSGNTNSTVSPANCSRAAPDSLISATPIKRRRGTNDVFERTFFDEDAQNPLIKTCKSDDCRQILKNGKFFNLERHVKTRHKKLFDLFCLPEPDPLSASLQEALETNRNLTTKKIYVRLSREELLADCVEICTVNGYPLSLMESSGMRKIMQKITCCFPEQFTVNRTTIKAAILAESSKIREAVKNDVKDKFLSLKVDCATRKLTSYIGINVQYINSGKIEARLLKIAAVYTRNSGINLKNIILDTLKEYNIPLANLISSTSDNGSNVLKMTRELHKHSQQMMSAFDDNDEDVHDFENGGEMAEDCEGADDDEDLDEDEDDLGSLDPATQAQHDMLVAQIDEALADIGVLEIRCAAHSLQLSIKDIITSLLYCDLIDKVRGCVAQLKKQTIMNIIHTSKAPKPVNDNKTRWNSTFDMLARFLQLKEFMQSHVPSVYEQMTEGEWETLEQIINALEPCAVATIKLQRENLPYSEVLPIFFSLMVSLREQKTIVADALVEAVEERKRLLFKPHLYAAVLLDRRYNRLLEPDELKFAELQLLSAWERIAATTRMVEPMVTNEQAGPNDATAPPKSMLQKIMEEREAGNARFRPLGQNDTANLKEKISRFLRQGMLDEKVDIVGHWETEKFHWPELYELSKFFLGIPATQTSVERLFSNLKFIKNDHRQCLGEELLQAIMTVRMYHYLSQVRRVRNRRRVIGLVARS